MLTNEAQSILSKRGLECEIVVQYGIESEHRNGGEWIKIPYFIGSETVNNKYRTLGSEKKFSQEPDGKCCVWNFNCLTDASLVDEPVIITEGEMDALSAIQAGFVRSVSVPNGAPAEKIGMNETTKYAYLDDVLHVLANAKEIILAFDNDAPGANLLHDIGLRLGKPRCKWIKYPRQSRDTETRCKDLNEVLQRFGIVGVQKTIETAQWIETDGVYDILDLPPEPEEKVYEINFSELREHYKIRKGDFCVVSGVPSSGKSSFLNDIACRMAETHDWKIAFASFEQSPRRDHLRNLRTWYCGKLTKDCTAQEISEADSWISRHIRVICSKMDADPTLAWIQEKIAMAVIQHHCDMVIIDPWNEMDHVRNPQETLTEYTGAAIKEFKRLAKKYRIHLIVAAHPAKMRYEKDKPVVPGLYDIADSSHWANKPDVGIIIHRPDKNDNTTEIHIKKIRYRGIIGKEGIIKTSYDFETGRYSAQMDLPRLIDYR